MSATVSSKWAKGSGGPSGDECQNLLAVPFVQNSRDEVRVFGDGFTVGALAAEPGAKQQCYIAFDCKGTQVQVQADGSHPTLRSMGHADSHSNAGGHAAALIGSVVRRLTPRECERLQGFPDDYTLVPHRGKPMADGPRYKALGNSMAVPVMRWIGERIAAVNALPESLAA